jgi:hypothetical protein
VEEELGDDDDKDSDASEVDSDPESENVESPGNENSGDFRFS